VKEISFPIANPLPYFYNINIPYIQIQHQERGFSMDTFSEVFKAIASYPWQVNVGVLSLIPLYIIDFKFFCKLNIGLQRKIALAKERGHVARGMIVKEDAKRLVVNNSQSAYSYWAARYTYTVDGKEYRKRFSCDKRHSTRSELRTIINVYWLDDPNKPFWDYSSDSLGAWFGIFTILFPWIGAILIIQLLGGADAIAQYNNSRM